jgi:hypothetical protein
MTESTVTDVNVSASPPSGFVAQICAYFRDFLDTDFRRQTAPKRNISLKDAKGNLTGIPTNKYPTLTADIWKALGKQLEANRQFNFTVGRGRYRSRVNPALLDVIQKHIASLETEELAKLGDRAKVAARDLRETLENDPERYRDAILTTLRNDLVRVAITPLVLRLESSIRNEGSDEFETAYNIEEELGAQLISVATEAIGVALASAIVDNKFEELDSVIDDVVNADVIKQRLTTYFETLHTSDFFQDLHELRSTLKLRENFEVYLYIGSITHNRISYPLFYIPLQIELHERVFTLTADPHLYINKKALEYAAQETAREIQRPVPMAIPERILYLDAEDSFQGAMQEHIDKWCADLALKPTLDLSDIKEQRAQRSQITINNAIHFGAFDKADESLLNDYEALLTTLTSGSEVGLDFQKIIDAFLTTEPANVNADVDAEWDALPVEQRLIFESPVPLNEEQRKILSALRHKDARFISIEGPPGTGKSHTITAIIFEAILRGQNVLVLSDKMEALDVVENKLNEVLDDVRFGDDFQNPILRLGRAGNTYSKILSKQAIESIRAHHRASTSAQAKFTAEIENNQRRLFSAIEQTVEYGEKIKMADVYQLQQHEHLLEKYVEKPQDIVADKDTIDALLAASKISEFLAQNANAVPRILRTVCGRVGLKELVDFCRVQAAGIIHLTSAQRKGVGYFTRFRSEDSVRLQAFVSEYRASDWPLVRYFFTRKKVEALNARLSSELNPADALNAHKEISALEDAYAGFAHIAATIMRSGLDTGYSNIAFQQHIEGLYVEQAVASQILMHISVIQKALEQRPELEVQIGLNPNALDLWAQDSASGSAATLTDVISYAIEYQDVQQLFDKIPDFDFAGEKSRLESLHAHRLANTLDGRVIHFADNYRNLSQGIRDIIRKKQQFPKENFATVQAAFPCMIAGIRDYAEYIPLEKGLFDIIIIDEASQVSIAQAFPALLRAKKLVVLGDRKQFSNVKTSNASIETNNQYANAIIENYISDNDADDDTINRLKLFNIKTSVLEFVERLANSHTMLRKHFRGYPELISFSSKTFYQGQLQAVKIRGVPVDDVICFTRIDHDNRHEPRNNVNTAEWEAILEELLNLADCDAPPSVGIITPFTEQQSYIIQALNRYDDLHEKLRLKVMTFDSCQGEERDIIIYSLVATPHQDKLAYIFPRSLEEADEVDSALRMQRLNVGFSRAKERIHIFHSLPLDAYRGAIGQTLNHYVKQLEIAHKRPTAADTDPKSPMEKQLLVWLEQTPFVQLLGENVEIDAQFELGTYLRQLDPTYRHPAYKVDFLVRVTTPSRVVSIVLEYDGFKEHFTDLEKVDAYNHEDYYRQEDVERQKILEGYGYRFLRVNRFNLGRDPVSTLDARLSKLADDALVDAHTHEIVGSIKESAANLLSGDSKTCLRCGEVKKIDDFRDQAIQNRPGRICMTCKQAERVKTASSFSGHGRRRWGR